MNYMVLVDQSLKDGWELVGGVSVSSHFYRFTDVHDQCEEWGTEYIFAQAMIKRP
jgi:hypothetical protein